MIRLQHWLRGRLLRVAILLTRLQTRLVRMMIRQRDGLADLREKASIARYRQRRRNTRDDARKENNHG